MEDSVPDPIQSLRIYYYTIRIDKRTGDIPKLYHTVLHRLLDIVCVVYLDDILIFSKDRDSYIEHIRQVLSRIREAELYTKLSKYTFYQEEVEFLGFIINS